MATDDEDLLAEIRGQAGELELERFDHEVARRIGETASRAIAARSLPATVRVVRGQQIAFQASFVGTAPEHDDWLRRKVNSAVRHDISTLELVLRHRVSGRVPDWLDPHEFAVAGGAVPVRVGGNLVDSIRADHDLAMGALRDATQGRASR